MGGGEKKREHPDGAFPLGSRTFRCYRDLLWWRRTATAIAGSRRIRNTWDHFKVVGLALTRNKTTKALIGLDGRHPSFVLAARIGSVRKGKQLDRQAAALSDPEKMSGIQTEILGDNPT